MQKTISLLGCLMLVGLVSFPSEAGIILKASRPPQAQPIRVTVYLPDENEPLQKALLIHNLMNEMPGLRDTARVAKDLEEQR